MNFDMRRICFLGLVQLLVFGRFGNCQAYAVEQSVNYPFSKMSLELDKQENKGILMKSQNMDDIPLTANWIWRDCKQARPYNDTIIARKICTLSTLKQATIRISADTEYRLFINDQWVNDGPCRSWPNHYQYDVIDAAPYLEAGKNEIRVIAKFFGTGTYHRLPQEPGLLVQLDVLGTDGNITTIITDKTWETTKAEGWLSNTPKQSPQVGAYEIYDARKANLPFKPAVVRYATNEGPWQGLMPRDVALLTRKPFPVKAFQRATVVNKNWKAYTFNIARLLYPDIVVSASSRNYMTSALATIIECPESMKLSLESWDLRIQINGQSAVNNEFDLSAGRHFLFAIMDHQTKHWRVDANVRFKETSGYTLINPVDGNADNPWSFVPFEGARYLCSQIDWNFMEDAEKKKIDMDRRQIILEVERNVTSQKNFLDYFEGQIQTLSQTEDVIIDAHWQFEKRAPIEGEKVAIKNPEGFFKGDETPTILAPNDAGDIELIYDLGEQNCGYYQFELEAEEGLVVDIAGVEYIKEDGAIQHTGHYRNGMRYICKEGRNTFTSLKRRSQRYLFITLRNQTKPVKIYRLQLIESTYPVQTVGRFACSDERLDKIWEISARTLKLCMEDTFTDCPLYEQTLWVGDARNEALFAFTAFGSEDIAKRCIRLAGKSLEKHPLILSHVPSTWENLLPAWSFLWGISVWDYYYYTGDKDFLEEAWPWVEKNLEGAASFSDERGLFSGPFWNMFDWSDIDQGQRTVLHNSMLAIGAIDAAMKCAEVLGEDVQWLQGYRVKLVNGVNTLWDEQKKSYPDSIRGDGSISKKTSMHTSFLSLNYGIVPEQYKADAINNILNTPDDMTNVGAPFAILYLYETLEKLGYHDRIMQSIYDSYLPMLEMGATTVWEQFPTGTFGPGGFPTRSHCHAWSSAPIHFLNRIVLGIIPTEVGGKAVTVSPRPSGLTWAKGASATTNGPVEVEWKLEKSIITIKAKGPKCVKLQFVPNKELQGIKVVFNGQSQ